MSVSYSITMVDKDRSSLIKKTNLMIILLIGDVIKFVNLLRNENALG